MNVNLIKIGNNEWGEVTAQYGQFRRRGFALAELLVIIAVSVCSSIFFCLQFRQPAKQQDGWLAPINLKQVAFAVHNFHDANNALPPIAIPNGKLCIGGIV